MEFLVDDEVRRGKMRDAAVIAELVAVVDEPVLPECGAEAGLSHIIVRQHEFGVVAGTVGKAFVRFAVDGVEERVGCTECELVAYALFGLGLDALNDGMFNVVVFILNYSTRLIRS